LGLLVTNDDDGDDESDDDDDDDEGIGRECGVIGLGDFCGGVL